MSRIDELDGTALAEVIRSESRGILVDFWSPWCAPCRTLRPHLERIAGERDADWRFVALNVEFKPEVAEAFDVKALPTLVFFQAGKEAFRFAGAATLSAVVAKLDELS